MRPPYHLRASLFHLSLPIPESFREQATSTKQYSRHFMGLLLIKYTEPEPEKLRPGNIISYLIRNRKEKGMQHQITLLLTGFDYCPPSFSVCHHKSLTFF